MKRDDDYAALLSALDKAEQGPVVEEKTWDREIIQGTAKDVVEAYEIGWDRDGSIVPNDDALADRVFEAGMQMALRTGVHCLDTKRQMLWSQEELDQALAARPSEAVVGAGDDRVVVKARRPESAARVAVWGGPWGVPAPEDLYLPFLESYAREPIFDMIDNATLLSTHGRAIRAGSPWEAVGAWQEAQVSLEAARRAGRPGLALGCVEISTTEVGELAGSTYGAYRPTDVHHAAFLSEQKTAYHQLTKVTHFAQIGAISEVYCNPMYGGYVGGGPGVAVALVSGIILLCACYGGHFFNSGPTHVHLDCSTHPDLVTATALAYQALSRNTHLLVSPFVRPTTGPGTLEIFYESGALTIATVVSGVALVDVVQSATGNHALQASPLEARFCGLLAHAVEGMTRADAEPIVRWMVNRYQDIQSERRIGRPFPEVYDLDLLKPTGAWQALYEQARTEVEREFGLKLEG